MHSTYRKMSVSAWLFISVMVFMLNVSGASAAVITFGDSMNYWQFDNGVSFPSLRYPAQNGEDVNGLPDILGGSIEVSGGHTIEALTINYTPNGKNIWNDRFYRDTWYNKLMFGDVFIDSDPQSGTWDYVISGTSVYSVSAAYGDDIYVDTPYAWNMNGGNGRPRWDHPVFASTALLDASTRLGEIDFFSGFSTYLVDGIATARWIFGDFDGLQLSGPILMGLTTNCANDVLLEEIPLPAPEPATMYLLAVGLIGLALFSRKLRRQ